MSLDTARSGAWTADDPLTFHRGASDLPYVPVGDGSHLQLVHVDMAHNVWVARQRFEPGTVLLRHRHTGPVQVVTLGGRWKYREYDDVNTAGSYLYEPAGSVHTFTVPAENEGITEIWFSITGSNLNLDQDGNIASVFDARSVTRFYFERCEEFGYSRPNIIES